MNLSKALQEVVNSYRTEIGLVRDFATDAHSMLHSKLLEHSRTRLEPEEKEQIREIVAALDEVLFKARDSNARPKKGPVNIQLKSSERVSKYIMQMTMPIRKQSLVAEMSLSHLVAYQEAFIKDYLYELLIRKREMLRTGGTTTFEKIVAHKSMGALVSAIARSEVNQLSQGGIDDIATTLEKRLNVRLSDYEKWPALRELSYRRNLIIHNKGRVDDAYRRNIAIGEQRHSLSTDLEYVKAAAETILGYIDFVHEAVNRKFRSKPKKARQMQSVNR